ncbi:MAG: hypothetical protein DELT_01247 [Desulfovibrio sp.]
MLPDFLPSSLACIDAALRDILACPSCRGPLKDAKEETGEEHGLLCSKCSLVYPVKEEIPVMLIEEAVPLAELRKNIHKVTNKA